MKILIASIITVFSISVFSQNQQMDGLFKEYYENGNLKTEGVFKNDNKVGLWKSYSLGGLLKSEKTFLPDGTWTGYERLYSLVGKLSIETKPDGNGNIIEKHYFENGNLKREFLLASKNEGKRYIKAGVYKEFYENDSLKIESTYVDNELFGVWNQFYKSGKKEWEINYVNGVKEGYYKQFYGNGQLKVEGVHELDLKSDEEIQFDSIGNQIYKLKYKKGELKNTSKYPLSVIVNVPDGVIEKAPVYPGCEVELGNTAKKSCMAIGISNFVVSKFNTSFGGDTNLKGQQKIYVIFKIDESGNIIDIKARANHRALEAEAIRVIALLPKMEPGFLFGEPVKVPFSIPIMFKI